MYGVNTLPLKMYRACGRVFYPAFSDGWPTHRGEEMVLPVNALMRDAEKLGFVEEMPYRPEEADETRRDSTGGGVEPYVSNVEKMCKGEEVLE